MDLFTTPDNQTYRSSLLRPLLTSCGESHADNWLAYHIANPEVYAEVCKLAEKMRLEVKRKNYSIGILIEVLRWHRDIQSAKNEEFKIPNAHRAFYARMYEWHYDCAGFFRKAQSFADSLIFPPSHKGLLCGKLPTPT